MIISTLDTYIGKHDNKGSFISHLITLLFLIQSIMFITEKTGFYLKIYFSTWVFYLKNHTNHSEGNFLFKYQNKAQESFIICSNRKKLYFVKIGPNFVSFSAIRGNGNKKIILLNHNNIKRRIEIRLILHDLYGPSVLLINSFVIIFLCFKKLPSLQTTWPLL